MIGENPDKASINSNGELLIDASYWDSLSDDSRWALLYHEAAHLQKTGCAGSCPAKKDGCERCADNRLGAQMALAGFPLDRIESAVKRLHIQSRRTAPADAIAGAKAVVRNVEGTVAVNALKPRPVPSAPSTPPSFRGPPIVSKDKDASPTKGEVQSKPVTPPSFTVPVNAAPCSCSNCRDFTWLIGLVGFVGAVTGILAQWLEEE